jgi:hypothetical protein
MPFSMTHQKPHRAYQIAGGFAMLMAIYVLMPGVIMAISNRLKWGGFIGEKTADFISDQLLNPQQVLAVRVPIYLKLLTYEEGRTHDFFDWVSGVGSEE